MHQIKNICGWDWDSPLNIYMIKFNRNGFHSFFDKNSIRVTEEILHFIKGKVQFSKVYQFAILLFCLLHLFMIPIAMFIR